MTIIENPKTGDDFIDLLIVTGITEETIQEMSRDIQNYLHSLTRAEKKEYLKLFRKVKKIYCSN